MKFFSKKKVGEAIDLAWNNGASPDMEVINRLKEIVKSIYICGTEEYKETGQFYHLYMKGYDKDGREVFTLLDEHVSTTFHNSDGSCEITKRVGYLTNWHTAYVNKRGNETQKVFHF